MFQIFKCEGTQAKITHIFMSSKGRNIYTGACLSMMVTFREGYLAWKVDCLWCGGGGVTALSKGKLED